MRPPWRLSPAALRAEWPLLRLEIAQWRRKRRQPLARCTRAYVARFGPVVRAGPFAGMAFTRRGVAMAEDVVAKLIGSYELELTEVVEEVIACRPPVVVNIGSGEGYYAVGLALRCRAAEVVAYDTDPMRQLWSARMAGVNRVRERVDIRGACDPVDLEHVLAGRRGFVLCDCEGAEADVIDPTRAPGLARCVVLVEVHDFLDASIAARLERALAPTHALEWILARPRWRNDFPILQEVPGTDYMDHDLAVNEFRPAPMRWLVARPRPTATLAGAGS